MEQKLEARMPGKEPDLLEAVGCLKSARRVLVMGCSGGGKTTMSLQLCKLLDLPFVSMDREFFWLPGWVKRTKVEERALISAKIAQERWLMDGTGPSTFDLRVPRADAVIWIRMPRMFCLYGAIRRLAKWYGRERLEMAPGCPERLDWEFLHYIWNFERIFAPKVAAGLAEHGSDVPVFQLKTRAQMRRLLDLLGAPA